jgi:hypothetical protein
MPLASVRYALRGRSGVKFPLRCTEPVVILPVHKAQQQAKPHHPRAGPRRALLAPGTDRIFRQCEHPNSSPHCQLMISVVPMLAHLKKVGEQGRKQINRCTRYMTVSLYERSRRDNPSRPVLFPQANAANWNASSRSRCAVQSISVYALIICPGGTP